MAYSGEFKVFFLSTARRTIACLSLAQQCPELLAWTVLTPATAPPASILSSFILTAHFTVLRTPVSPSPPHFRLCGSFFTKSHGHHPSGLWKDPISLRKHGLLFQSRAKLALLEPGDSLYSRSFLAMPKHAVLLQTMQAVVGSRLLTSTLMSSVSQCRVHQGSRVCGGHLMSYMGTLVNS